MALKSNKKPLEPDVRYDVEDGCFIVNESLKQKWNSKYPDKDIDNGIKEIGTWVRKCSATYQAKIAETPPQKFLEFHLGIEPPSEEKETVSEPTTPAELSRWITQCNNFAFESLTGRVVESKEDFYKALRYAHQIFADVPKIFEQLPDYTCVPSVGLEKIRLLCKPVPLLSPRARLILDKLKSLKPLEAMTTNQLLDWLYEVRKETIDEGTLRRALRELKPFGMYNRKRFGYCIKQ